MAKRNGQTANTAVSGQTADNAVVDKTTQVQKQNKAVAVKFLGMVRASYGAYDAGDVAEVEVKIGKMLIENGLAEAYTAPAEKDDEEN